MDRARIDIGEPTGRHIPATILGHNLELYQHTTRDLSSNRLENHRFLGPPNPQTGIAPRWAPPTSNFSGILYDLCPGDGVMGSWAQRIENTSGAKGVGILQPGRWVRRGETLEVVLWARALHRPTTVRVGLRRASVWAKPDADAEILITSARWKRYRAELEVPRDDDNACFFIFLEEKGVIFLDHVRLARQGEGIVRSDVREALGRFRIPSLRFPGGCVTTAYHWKYGTGSHVDRPALPDPVFKGSLSYEFGTDEYLAFCRDYDVRPHICVNLGTDMPGETAEWAAYCADWYSGQGQEPPVMYWQIGNEQYGIWERSHMTPPMYVEAVREIAPAIRGACPTARIIALGQELGSSPPEGGERPRWRDSVIEGLAGIVDALALQIYCIVPPGGEQLERHHQVLDEIRWLGTQIEHAVRDVEKTGHDLKVGMSEWNLWTEASHFAESFAEPMDIQHGVFTASVFHHFMRLAPRFEFANYYHLIAGMGLFSVERDEVHRSLVAEVFQLYRNALPAERLELAVDSTRITGEHPALAAAAVHDQDETYVFLINRHAEEAIRVEITGGTAGDGRLIYGQSPGDTEGRMEPITASSRNELELPPLSIARLAIT